MWSLRPGRMSYGCRAGCVIAASFALLSGGCASQQAGSRSADAAATATAAVTTPRRVVGDDGLPPQHDIRSMPDAPSQPWSPNDGRGWQPKEVVPSRTPRPIDAGPTLIATMDQDALVRRAIAEHEMQRQ